MDKINVQDLVNVVAMYKEELANAMESKLLLKSMLDRSLKRIQELEEQIKNLQQPVESKGDDE